jgi:uncharacterized lipoprotein YmbA
MRISMRRFVLLLAAIPALPACWLLAPREDSTQYAVLASVDELPGEAPAKTIAASSALRIGLGPVTLPEYLRRPEVVSRVQGTRIELSGTERWAEPLDQALVRVLAIDLGRAMGAGSVVNYPWYEYDRPALQIEIVFSRCERDETGKVVLAARWSLRELEGAAVPIEKESRIVRETAGPDGASTARALSQGLAELCREIARARSASGAAPEERR